MRFPRATRPFLKVKGRLVYLYRAIDRDGNLVDVLLSDTAFHAKLGDPTNLKICERGLWNTRMLVETVLSMVTGVCHLKKVAHRTWAAFQTRLAFTLATFNLLVQWHGLKPDAHGFVHLSLAEFSL